MIFVTKMKDSKQENEPLMQYTSTEVGKVFKIFLRVIDENYPSKMSISGDISRDARK